MATRIYDLPDELKWESYERRPHAAVFDRLDLVVAFRAGHENKGGVVKAFLDAIRNHDELVVRLESQMVIVDELRRDYRKKNRLFRNLDSAWNLILDNPVDYNEYLDLLPRMKKIHQEIEECEDPIEKMHLTSLYERFQELDPLCSRQLQIYRAYSKARDERDEAVRVLLAGEKKVTELKEQEKLLASLISDDHIMADEMKKPLSLVFPNVQVGYILAKINGEHVENLPFQEVMTTIRRSRSPHNAVFLRYDYRYDPFCGYWRSLQELRDLGVCVEDPLLQKMHFISLATRGDGSGVHQLLQCGEDPNGVDLTGNTALVAAATNRHEDVVKLLFRAGADINRPDRNMMTPLLYCANRGLTEMVKLLLTLGADRSHTDRNLRGPIFYAVLSGKVEIVELFFKVDKKDITERLWGFSPLHLAANQGDLAVKGRTAEEVAEECGHKTVHQRLIEERLSAPGQLVHVLQKSKQQQNIRKIMADDASIASAVDGIRPMEIWIGDAGAMEVVWCADANVTAIIYLRSAEQDFPPHSAWLRSTSSKKKTHRRRSSDAGEDSRETILFRSFVIPDRLEDGDNNDNWLALRSCLPEIVAFSQSVAKAEGQQRLVVCDDTCRSLSPALAAVLMLILDQVRVKDALAHMYKMRPGIEIKRDVKYGLQDLQQQMDVKVLKRLNKQSRDSVVCSLAF
eukprot:scaffold13700_cov252-Ochromonas_danica.AAC.19